MLFNSSQLGTIDIDESTIITFPQGIPGLENCTEFKLFHNADLSKPSIFWLQSLNEPGITFSVTTPEHLGLHYNINLDEAETGSIGLKQTEDAAILILLYTDKTSEESHPALGQLRANIRNPLIINHRNRQAMQKTGLQCDILLHN